MAYPADPWAMSEDEEDAAMEVGTLDITGESEDEHVRTVPHLQSSPGWITQQKRQAFLHGCPHTDHLAKMQAYQALRTPSAVQSYLGLDTNIGTRRISDVRSQPVDRDPGYPAALTQGHGPDTAAIIECLLRRKDLIEACGMIYMIVDNRAPEEVGHWPAFAQWWAARRTLVGPQQECTDVLWVQATHANGLRSIPYYWAGVFVLEAARFLFPQVHFGLVDNDCVPVTLFEVQDLIALAESQFQWPQLTGFRTDPDLAQNKTGVLLFTEAHLEYNAGLVISVGSPNRPSPVEATSTAESLAEELEDYRQQLLAMAAPPECPTEASQRGSLFTPLLPGCPNAAFLPPWCLLGASQAVQMVISCLPGASLGATQAVQLVLSCLPGASQACPKVCVICHSMVSQWELQGCTSCIEHKICCAVVSTGGS